MMNRLRIAVLVDLLRETASGGHVKYWERMAEAAARENLLDDITFYFSGTGTEETLSSSARIRLLPPIFSSARLKFLPYVPAHTDLSPHHPRLAKELPAYDIIHTTDACFAYAQTAERVSAEKGIPLVTSFHTDTPAYTELFTHQTLQILLGEKLGGWADSAFHISAHQKRKKEERLKKHLAACHRILIMRSEDKALAEQVTSSEKIRPMRLAVDKELFAPRPDARKEIEIEYGIPSGRFLVLFVGRVDAGKNMPLLLDAVQTAIGQGTNLHLLVAGLGPISDKVKSTLGPRATLAGFVSAHKLAKFFAGADCLAMASDIEIGGLVGVEALASGIPVLVSNKSGVASLCGGTAAMKEVESNASSWANALTSLALDPVRQKEMREAALLFRREKLADWNQVLREDFLRVWHEVAPKRQK